MAIKSANVVARVEPDIKMRAEEVLNRLGVPASIVINALYRQIIYTNSIPFSLTVPSLENMSSEEFDEMMRTSLNQAKQGEGEESSRVFEKLISELDT